MDQRVSAQADLESIEARIACSVGGSQVGLSRLALEAHDTGVRLTTRNNGDGSDSIVIRDKADALWLAEQLVRIFA